MELHMVHDLKEGSAPVSARTDSAAALPEDAALDVADADAYGSARSETGSSNSRPLDTEPLDTAKQNMQGSVKLPQLTSPNSSSGDSKAQEARKVFDNFANGKQFLHKAALSEVLKNAYRSAHNSSSRQAEAAVELLLERMKIDTTALPPPPLPKDEDQLLAEEQGIINEEVQDTQEEWLRHVYNPEHITFEEFIQAWDSWQDQ
jgi:hypothetical protein